MEELWQLHFAVGVGVDGGVITDGWPCGSGLSFHSEPMLSARGFCPFSLQFADFLADFLMESTTPPTYLAIIIILSLLRNGSTVGFPDHCRVCRLVVGSREMVSRHHILRLSRGLVHASAQVQ